MTAYKESACFVTYLLITLLSLTTFAIASEVVEPGETQQFTGGDDCVFTPFSDGLFKATNAKCVLPPARVEAAALLTVAGFNNDVTAFATLVTEFSVTSGNETVLGATVSAKVDWEGVLFGAGLLGAGASVRIEMFLVDDTTGTIKGQTVVMAKSQDSTGLKGIDIGGTRVRGDQSVSFKGSVVRGHQHSILLKLTCSAESGLIGLDVGCIFFNNVFLGVDLGGDPHAKWTELSITVEQDIFERLDQIDMKLEEMDDKLDSLLGGQNDIQRLLLTPHGRRSSELGDFPLHPEFVSDDASDIDAFCSTHERSGDCKRADWLDDESGSPRDCRWRGGACEAR